MKMLGRPKTDVPLKRNRISTYVDDNENAMLKAMADKQGVSISCLIYYLIGKALEKEFRE